MTDKEKREFKDGVISIFKKFNILDHTATIGGLRDDILRYIDSLQNEPISEELEDAASSFARKYSKGINNPANFYYTVADKARIFKAGAEWQKERFVSKACEYLKDNIWRNLYFVNGEAGFPTAEFIKGFRKAMEE